MFMIFDKTRGHIALLFAGYACVTPF